MPKIAQDLRYWDDTPVNLPAKAPRAKPKPDAPTEPFAVTVHRGDALLLEETAQIERHPVGGLPQTRPTADRLADAFGAPKPTTAFLLDHERVVFLTDGDLWIRFRTLAPWTRPARQP